MHNIKKIKHDCINTAFACSLLFCSMPNRGNGIPSIPPTISIPSFGEFDAIICNLLNHASESDFEGVELQFKNIAEVLAQSDDALTDSCQFLEDLVNKLNAQYGTALTLHDLLQITRNSIRQFQIEENKIENYMVGLDLIELHQSSLNEVDSGGLALLVKHHKNKSSFWTWLTVATITVAAVTVCIVVPEVAPAVISGAVEVGKTTLGK